MILATPYSEITDSFVGIVTEYKFFNILKEDRDEWLTDIMDRACARFRKSCRKNLDDRNEELRQFNVTLDADEIDIIHQLMIAEWLRPQLFSCENLENKLNTKDYSEYSPANLLKEIRSTHEYAVDEAKNMIKNYTFSFRDLGDKIDGK